MQPLCQLNQLPELCSKGFELNSRKVLAVNFRGNYYVYENSCPHRSIPLEWQPDQFLDYDKTFIQCATHGALFKIDTGECIAGPCVADSLTTIPCEVRDDILYVDL